MRMILSIQLSTAPLHEIIIQLTNSTIDEPILEGRNLLIARETLHRIIDSKNKSLVRELVGDEELLNRFVHSPF